MAIKEFKPAKSRYRIKYKKTYLGVFIAFLIVSVFCVGYRINTKAEIAEYEEQIAGIEAEIKKLSDENEYNLSVINSTDRSDYYEKQAREVHDYVKPGEYVFYKKDVS